MSRLPPVTLDPAADAASLLRRLGFLTLMVLVPLAALVARRAVVVLVPVGIALVIIAAALDRDNRPLGAATARLWRAPAFLAAALFLGWCFLSLLWTPFVMPGLDRLGKILATIALAIGGYLCLPDRMRSANIYLLPLGVGFGALLAAFLHLSGLADEPTDPLDEQNLDRGLVVVVLLLWPAIAWLRSRRRDLEALGLALMVGAAAGISADPVPLFALGIGALVYVVAEIDARAGTVLATLLTAGILLLAPLIPFLAAPLLDRIGGGAGAALAIWRDIVAAMPVRLVTGHGFEAALRSVDAGLLPAATPDSALFEIWYDLGIVGVGAACAALALSIRAAAARGDTPLLPGTLAAFASGFAFAALGVGTAQMWWVTALVVVVVIFVAAERGQFRTKRPPAAIFRKGEAAESAKAP